MSRPSKALRHAIWCWRKWVAVDAQVGWIERLQVLTKAPWTALQRPNRSRILLDVYLDSKRSGTALMRILGGQVQVLKASAWLDSRPTPPTRIGPHLEIVHDPTRRAKSGARAQLCIPHGLAFGSGDHGTTHLLLRTLMEQSDLTGKSVLDLGTGSGVLALGARLIGAKRIVATDFDPEAIRTARQNETLNFFTPLIKWRCADVTRLRASPRYHLVLANLFSGILIEATPQISASVAPGGQLWASGVLRSQQDDVIAAYRATDLRFVRATRRGKWVMLQWQQPISSL